MNDSVYNSTTVSYENPGTAGSPNCRPWNLSEMVAPPVSRRRWVHWATLIGGIASLIFGITVCFLGVYSHLKDVPESNVENVHDFSSGSGGWLVVLLGCVVAVFGIFLLLIYCRLTNNRFFCHRLSNTRNALRKVITKPRFNNTQANRGANLLANDTSSFQPTLSAQYDPVTDIGYGQNNGDEPISEERAKLMAHEAKEGRPILDDDDERLEFEEPQDIRNAYKSGRVPGLEWGCISDIRRTSSLYAHRNQNQQEATPSPSHYKPRHFAGHGYGQKARGAPLASMEEITPSLRSSFASVLMYPPSSWGGSDESLPSDFFANDYENGSLKKQGSFSALSVQSDFQ